MAVVQFVRENPALAPLFVCVGLGVVGSFGYLARMGVKGPDVVFDRKNNPFPWQRIQQHQNIKFMAVNQKFDRSPQ